MALNCINLYQKCSEGFGGRGAAPDPAGGLGGSLAWEYGLEYFCHYIPGYSRLLL